MSAGGNKSVNAVHTSNHKLEDQRKDQHQMEEFNSQYEEIDIQFISPDPAMARDPDKIKIDNINRPRKTEAYTIVHLSVDWDCKTNASV